MSDSEESVGFLSSLITFTAGFIMLLALARIADALARVMVWLYRGASTKRHRNGDRDAA